MPISSLIIRTEKDKAQQVAHWLRSFKGVTISEIHHENVIVVTETGKQAEDKTIWGAIEKIPGVLQCDLIYHNFEDEEGFSRAQ